MPLTTIGTAAIDDNAITSAKIADGTVVAADIAANSVDSSELVDGSIDTSHIANAQVTLAKMAVNSIDSDQYVDGSIDTAHIANVQVTLAKMAVNSIDSDQYVDASIDLAHMSVNSIDSDQYVDGSIDTAHIAASQITNALMADDAIDSAEIVAGAIDSAHLATTVNLTGKTVTVPDGFTLGSTAVTATGAELNTIADQYGYMTVWVDAGAMVSTSTAGAASATNEYATNDVNWDYLAFDTGGTEEQAQFKIVMPEAWNLGTIKAKFYWSSASGSTAGDTVEWGLKGRALANDDAIDSAFGTEQVITDTVLAGTNADVHITAATPAITIGNTPALNDICAFEVHRNTDGTDNMAEDAWLFGILIQITTTSTISAW
jgi:hypothetical protein